jgi:tetraacyldisaccharide 4'-kinase
MHQAAASWLQALWHGSQDPSLANPLHAGLWLASGGYRLGLAVDQWLKRSRRRRLSAVVVSVGNLAVGGTGKTPFTLWLAETLIQAGMTVAILSRGYGRQSDLVARVREPQDGWSRAAALYGDEPVLLARRLPSVAVWVGRSRYAAGFQAIQQDAPSVLILDDGFQHRSLQRDLDVVLLDAERPFGNGRLLPMGPLREPIHHLSRAGALVLTRATDGDATLKTQAMLKESLPDKPVFACTHKLSGLARGFGSAPMPPSDVSGKVAVAFAGIARPESFFASLREASPELHLAEAIGFPDHHVYCEADGELLLRSLQVHQADCLLTTEKDWVRLPGALQPMTLAARMDLDFGADLPRLSEHFLTQIRAHRAS